VTHFPATSLDQGFGYDDLDRLTSATAGATTRGYAYDLTGNRTQATLDATTDTYTTAPTSNRLTGITGGVTRTMTYDAMGNLTSDGNVTATYDARGRLRTIRIGAAANTTYVYDGLGQRIRKSGGPAGTVQYLYDEGGKLLGEYNSNGVATREYVWLGDMPLAVLSTTETLRDNTTASTTYVGTWGTATTPTGFYGSNYRTHPAEASPSGDNVTWNLATSTGTYRVYARWPANATHSATAVYRVTHASGTTDVTVNQRLDGAEWVLLGTFSLTSANSKVTLFPQADGSVAADAVKAVNTSEASRIFFVHADHLNAPRAVVNSANQLRWRWLSDPFGYVPPEDNPAGLGTFALNLRLPGQVYDLESNLHYNYFRDYDSTTGRYVQSDPIGLAGGINTYAYVENNPVSLSDPDGLQVLRPQPAPIARPSPTVPGPLGRFPYIPPEWNYPGIVDSQDLTLVCIEYECPVDPVCTPRNPTGQSWERGPFLSAPGQSPSEAQGCRCIARGWAAGPPTGRLPNVSQNSGKPPFYLRPLADFLRR
jgi:RHS repeat-associated protein